jgi:hypothetical protein
MSPSTRRAFALASALVLGLAPALVTTSATASPSTGSTKYVTAKPLCGTPKAGHAQCFAMRRVAATASTPGARPMIVNPGFATGPAGGYTPGDLATAYGVNPDTATSQVVGIVDANDDPNALSDLDTFDAQYGLPAETSASFQKFVETGATTDAGWAGEISLDLDAVRGMCHKCKIVLVETATANTADLASGVNEAVSVGATVISNSYGGRDNVSIPTAVVNAYNHPGVVITASTGDNGMFDWDNVNVSGGTSSNAPEFPSSANTVVAVGGTTLYLNSDATRSAESVWNENGPGDLTGGNLGAKEGATGGGCSSKFAAQGWQHAVANYAETTCGTGRLAADVSALADPFTGYDIFDTISGGGWQTFGGTSLASPLIAAMWAMAGGSGGVSYPSLSLYGHFKSDKTHPLYDVGAGGNGFCDGIQPTSCSNTLGGSPNTAGLGILDCAFLPNSATLSAGTRECDAATGYDGPSGVGTPVGLAAFTPMGPTAKLTVPATVTHGVSASFSGSTSTDPFPGGKITTYSFAWGDGTTTTGTSKTVSHTYATAGSKSLTLTVTDNYGRTGSVTTSVTVH